MSTVPVVLIGLGLVLLVISPLFFRATGTGTAGSGVRGTAKPGSGVRGPGKKLRASASANAEREGLEEEKARLIQALRELEEEHQAGRIGEQEYTSLKSKYEMEAAAVYRQLDRTSLTPDPGPPVDVGSGAATPSWQRALAWAGVVIVFVGAAGFALMTAVQPRAEGAPMTGIQLGGGEGGMGGGGGGGGGSIDGLIAAMARAAGTVDSAALPALEARLAADSTDLKALVQAGHLFLAEQRLDDAAHVSMQALEIEHGNLEAHSHVALLLLAQGELNSALEILDRVLIIRADFPEALLYQGTILLAQGRDPSAPWERWLEMAPETANLDRIRNMLAAVKARQ